MAFKLAIGKAIEMGDDFVSAHNQVVSNTPGEPLSDTEPKVETEAPLSSNNSFSPVLEEFPTSDEIQAPAQLRHECDADTSDADVSESEWKSIDEDTSEEVVDDKSTSDGATEDPESPEEATEDENASESEHSEPTSEDSDDLASAFSSNMDPNSVTVLQIMRGMARQIRHGRITPPDGTARTRPHSRKAT
ncbi:hypothetical protein N0V84_003796 [Fusarium piperis]|uniref:Uncharacterized protein n=1 Tax=Fusarium piperis TaxID=1435070 RepID=A0A9W9BS45_9HYPO|nr:hypothetical protein N0V84_003796 [Fusarium piperis]